MTNTMRIQKAQDSIAAATAAAAEGDMEYVALCHTEVQHLLAAMDDDERTTFLTWVNQQ